MVSNINLKLISLYNQLYKQQKAISDEHLDQIFRQRNEKILEQIDAFIDESLKGGYAFESLQSYHIHCAAAMLGPLEQELKVMIDTIDLFITKKKKVKVFRLTSDICKRADLKPLIDDVEKTDRCIVIVEYTESLMKHQLEELLIASLYKLLNTNVTDRRIMILFCLLSNATNIDEIYLGVETTMLKTYPNINKDPIKESESTIKSKLMNMDGMYFEMAPYIVSHLSRNFMEIDPSSMELKSLYDFCLSSFFSSPRCLVHLPDEQLHDCLKSIPDLKMSLRELPSIRNAKSNVPWKDPKQLSKFLRETVDNLRKYHVYLMKQIQHYADIIADPANEHHISDQFDIYTELAQANHINLAESESMIEAINSIPSMNQKVLMSRIEMSLKSTENKVQSPMKMKKTDNVAVILFKYLRILENNPKSPQTLVLLANDLMQHMENLKNPLKQPFNELFYYKNLKAIREHTIPIVRRSILECKGNISHYDILSSLVMLEGDVINLKDLYDNFKDKISDQVDDDEMVKLIFNEKLEAMILHGVIKLIQQGKKKGCAKRMAWL